MPVSELTWLADVTANSHSLPSRMRWCVLIAAYVCHISFNSGCSSVPPSNQPHNYQCEWLHRNCRVKHNSPFVLAMHKVYDNLCIDYLQRSQAQGRPLAAAPNVVRLVRQREGTQMFCMLHNARTLISAGHSVWFKSNAVYSRALHVCLLRREHLQQMSGQQRWGKSAYIVLPCKRPA